MNGQPSSPACVKAAHAAIALPAVTKQRAARLSVMIAVTENAVKHLRELLLSDGVHADKGLRLSVQRGGCAGMEYAMKLDARGAHDHVFESQGVAIIVDPGSLSYLDGSRLDYVDGLNDAGFKLENPNAARSCGCGTSFEPLVPPENSTQ